MTGGREQRLVFGEVAELYDAHRPSYPADLVAQVVALAGAGARVADVACGTGKASVALAAAGLSGAAVDADPSMAGVARRNLAPYPGWRVEVSAFEQWRPADAPFDLLTCAQGWHWLDPAGRARTARALLRPGGWLTLWWNRPDAAQPPVAAAIDAVYARLAPEVTRALAPEGAPPLDELAAAPGFASPQRFAFHWARDYTGAQWTALMRTQSDHRMLAPARREDLLAAVGEAIAAAGGVYRHRYVSWLLAAQAE